MVGKAFITHVDDPNKIRAYLNKDRPLAAVALSALDGDGFSYGRYYLSDQSMACIWAFEHSQFGNAVATFGDTAALSDLIARAELPNKAHLTITPEHREVVGHYYDLTGAKPWWRMHVTPEIFRHYAGGIIARELSIRDGEQLTALYLLWNGSHFDPSRLEQGQYIHFGVSLQGHLVACAFNFVRSDIDGVALIQGVFVHPDWRGRGLGKAVTAAVVEAMFARGIRDVVLDVREVNAPAIAVYERLGFRKHCRVIDHSAAMRISP